MIEFGTIEIRDEKGIVDSRNKVYALAEDLKFDIIDARKLATVTSTLGRIMLQNGKPSSITAGLDKLILEDYDKRGEVYTDSFI